MSQRQARRICFDRILPSELHKEQPAEPVVGAAGRSRAIMPKKKWVVGTTIHIRFLEGAPDVRRQVETVARRWLDDAHANLRFVFTDDPAAEVRIAFNPADGAWSYLGIDNLSIP